MSGHAVHRWWYQHAHAAGHVGAGMTSGLNMHRARLTFATDLRRIADLGAASQALGHFDVSTTASIYDHYDLSGLERAMKALAHTRGKTKSRSTESFQSTSSTAWLNQRWRRRVRLTRRTAQQSRSHYLVPPVCSPAARRRGCSGTTLVA